MVDGTGLENRRSVKATEGSNPSLSAKKSAVHLDCIFLGRNGKYSNPGFCGAKEGAA